MSKKTTVIHVNVEDRDRLKKLRQYKIPRDWKGPKSSKVKFENLTEVFTRAVDALEREMTEVFEQEPEQEPKRKPKQEQVESICEDCGRIFDSKLGLSKHQAWSKKLGGCRT